MLARTLCLLMVLLGSGCWVGDTPAPRLPVIDASVGGGATHDTCECSAGAVQSGDPTGLQGRAYRFTELRIEEPYALASLLNGLWDFDIEHHILNVLFVVETASESHTGYPFRGATLRAASGWRDPPQLWLPEGMEPDSYCILPGTSSAFGLQPSRECAGRCEISTTGQSSLAFYAGNLDDPLNCSPHLGVPHSIPISQMDARFVFNEDCSELLEGRLTACLRREDTRGICMCTRSAMSDPPWAYQCVWNDPLDMDPPASDADGQALQAYCGGCGTGPWMTLGGYLRPPEEGTGLPPCDPPIGMGGYKVSGVFRAVDITERFNPRESADCTEPAGGE